ncbi:MAG TPA: amidase [Solirubrobacteraceae bacterium]|jgi:Asp-tRNA(Asn)/Glu-tRNA(Gln) amidotransferase A subunit family amidase|nr:amidase [Solirubrobacteraceae bacterium]
MHELTATAVARLIALREITSVEIVSACLERISARDGALRAWAHVDAERALDAALARDAEPSRNLLHGVPVAIKDVIDTADLPTAYGSPAYAGHRPARDADCVALLERAGAVIVGKTATTEFALYHPAATVNPHDAGRTPGGSSSGSAAAVADGMVPVALGTQTAGSIVRPAAFCGVFGLKPTFGIVPTTGILRLSAALDTVGWFARSAEDLRLVGEVLGLRAPRRALPPRARVAFLRTAQWEAVEPGVRERIDAAMEALGAEDLALPERFAELPDAQTVIMERDVFRGLGEERDVSAELAAVLERGSAVSDAEYATARGLARVCQLQLPELVDGFDVVVTPAVRGEAPKCLDATGDPLFCRMWTLLGAPCVAVPGLRGPDGLPLGVQVVASPGRDDRALAAAEWLAPRVSG